jgi:hypothetical protein
MAPHIESCYWIFGNRDRWGISWAEWLSASEALISIHLHWMWRFLYMVLIICHNTHGTVFCQFRKNRQSCRSSVESMPGEYLRLSGPPRRKWLKTRQDCSKTFIASPRRDQVHLEPLARRSSSSRLHWSPPPPVLALPNKISVPCPTLSCQAMWILQQTSTSGTSALQLVMRLKSVARGQSTYWKNCQLYTPNSINRDVRFDVITAVSMKNDVFWYIKTQFVLHRRHITTPLHSPSG